MNTNKAKTRVLVVDDEESIRDSLNIILSDLGYTVEIAGDGHSALAAAQAADFDVAVIDRILPNFMNGVEVIQEIKKCSPFCETVLMSAYPSFESAAKIMEHDAMAYLTKPIRQEELCRVVEAAARKSLLRREAEHADALLRGVFSASPNPIIVYDDQMRITFVNTAFTSLLGYSREEALGQILLLVPQSDAETVRSEFQSIFGGGEVREREQVMLRSDGTQVQTSRIVSFCQGGYALVIIRDISEEKKMLAQIVQSEKLAMLGQLAAKLAHEINNPLQAITGQTQLLMNDPACAGVMSQLKFIEEAGRRIAKLTCSLMDVSRPKPARIAQFPPEQPLDKAANFLLAMGNIKCISLVREYGCDGELIEGDASQLEQVCMNLIANAAHAVEKAGRRMITLRTGYDPELGTVRISVADTGCGIAGDIQDKIFEPFFTTKQDNGGYGLGLTVVKQIVDRHAGSIRVTSAPGGGTTFTISLPARRAWAQEGPPVSHPAGTAAIGAAAQEVAT